MRLHEEIIHVPCVASLSEGDLVAVGEEQGSGAGARITAVRGGRPLSMQASFQGARGRVHFEAWGDAASPITSPIDDFDPHARIVRAHAVTLRKLHFEGELSHPGGSERLEGIGYFQRVYLDFPAVPWKWIWVVFEDGSVFSCFVPYLGLHLFRGGAGRLFPGPLERAALSVGGASGYFNRAGSSVITDLPRVRITPTQVLGSYPRFAVEARSPGGDFVRFMAAPYGASRLVFERPFVRGIGPRYSYNEYCFRVEDLAASSAGRPLGAADLGNGFGTCEYTWGLGL